MSAIYITIELDKTKLTILTDQQRNFNSLSDPSTLNHECRNEMKMENKTVTRCNLYSPRNLFSEKKLSFIHI